MQTELRESFECSDASSFLEQGHLAGLNTNGHNSALGIGLPLSVRIL